MNDKNDEPPLVTDGYGVSVAYACIVDAVRAIQIEIRPDIHQPVHMSRGDENARGRPAGGDDDGDFEDEESTGANNLLLHEQIINSTWSGLLSALCTLIESWLVFSFDTNSIYILWCQCAEYDPLPNVNNNNCCKFAHGLWLKNSS